MLRLIKGVTRRDRLRNEDIRAELQVKSILQFIEEARLRWYGHVRRMSNSRTAQRWLEWKPNTARLRGRPRKRWMDDVKEAVEVRGSTPKEIEQSATALFLDRSQWKNFVTDRPNAYQHCDTRSLNIWPVCISAWAQDLLDMLHFSFAIACSWHRTLACEMQCCCCATTLLLETAVWHSAFSASRASSGPVRQLELE